MKLYSLEGNRQWLDGGAMFGNAPKALWSKWLPCDKQNRVLLSCRALLVDTGKVKVLFELGIGAFFEPKLQQRYGVEGKENALLKNLKLIGVNEDSIDYVIPSHLHFDHIGGWIPDYPAIENDSWQLNFSNAKILIGKRQWDHALKPHPRDRASYIPKLHQKLQESKQVILIEDNYQTLEEPLQTWLSFRFYEGHTQGLMLAFIKGDKETLVFCSDLIPGTPWVPVSISMGYDRFAEKALDEKETLLKEALKNRYLLFYTHDAEFCASYVELSKQGKYAAVNKKKIFNIYEL